MNEPTIVEDDAKPFVVRVKLLTNEVFDFEIDKNIKVSEFKTIISPKVNVPVDRMRIVFSGKQLHDDKPMSEYVSESGLTVHLIARLTQPDPPQNSSQQSPQPQPQQTNGQQPNGQQVPPNPFDNIMGMVGNLFGQGMAGQSGQMPQIQVSFGGNPFTNLLGGFGINPPQQSQQNQNQPQPPTANQNTQQQNNRPQSNSNTSNQSQQPPRISYSQIGELNFTLNNLNLPLDNITTNQQMLTQEGVIRYLRRLHHQSTRALSQLNRALNLQGSNTQNLENFIPVFESINSANTVAINCLNELRNQRLNNQVAQSQQQPQQSQQSQQPQQPQSQPLQAQQQPQSQTQTRSQAQTQQQNQQNQPQNPLLSMLGNFGNMLPQMMSQLQPQPQQQQQQQPQQQQQQPNPLQMLGGLNLSSMLSSVGGMNGLFSLTLREMMTQNESVQEPDSILLDIFGGMTGQNVLSAFTAKDFKFLNEKRSQIRSNLLNRINSLDEETVIEKLTSEVSVVLIPNGSYEGLNRVQVLREKCLTNIKTNVKSLVKLSIEQNVSDYDLKVLEICKSTFCRNVELISEHTQNTNTNLAFEIIKRQTIQVLNPILPGLSGMLYALIERDLLRIYQEYKVEQERKNQMTNEDAQNEERLLEMIKEAGERDASKLAEHTHSASYYGTGKEGENEGPK